MSCEKNPADCRGNEQAVQSRAGAPTVGAPGSPLNKSQLARVLGIARSSLYVQCKRPKADKALAVRIEAAHEKDDPMGHGKLAALLGTGKHRVRRVMHNYGIAARRKRKKYVYRGLASEIAPNKLREEAFEWVRQEVVFSDILEVKHADGTRLRGCFAALAPHAPGAGHRV
jgi:putative transposase